MELHQRESGQQTHQVPCPLLEEMAIRLPGARKRAHRQVCGGAVSDERHERVCGLGLQGREG